MDMVIKAMAENGHIFDNIKHEFKTPTATGVPEYVGISLEMTSDILIKKVI